MWRKSPEAWKMLIELSKKLFLSSIYHARDEKGTCENRPIEGEGWFFFPIFFHHCNNELILSLNTQRYVVSAIIHLIRDAFVKLFGIFSGSPETICIYMHIYTYICIYMRFYAFLEKMIKNLKKRSGNEFFWIFFKTHRIRKVFFIDTRNGGILNMQAQFSIRDISEI